MNLNEINHTITNIAKMLDSLVETGVIDMQVKRNLLPVILQLVLKNQAVSSEYIEE